MEGILQQIEASCVLSKFMLLSWSLLDRTHFSREAIQEGGKRFLRRNISLFYLIPYLHTLEKLTTIYLVFSFLIYRMEKYLVRHGYQVSQARRTVLMLQRKKIPLFCSFSFLRLTCYGLFSSSKHSNQQYNFLEEN